MKIQIENLGILRLAEFSLGDITIICGGNNTGKTYATYALFGFLYSWREEFYVQIGAKEIDQLFSDGVTYINLVPYVKKVGNILSAGCRQYEKQLPMIFAAPEDRFQNSRFCVSINEENIQINNKFERRVSSADSERFSITKEEGSSELVVSLLVDKDRVKIPRRIISRFIGDAIKEIIFGGVFPNPFIASAERTGAAIFRKELNFPRNRLLEEMSRTDKNIDPFELLLKIYQDYPLPVKTNVEFLRKLEAITKKRSFIARDHPALLDDFSDILGGEYKVSRDDELYFSPKNKRVKLSMDESSSSVRALLGIGFYLKHIVQPSDLLMIDEPELNLHPENQRRLARLFARLCNLGVKIFITTHSDYFIKELNTLIMLNNDKPHLKQIAKREGYLPEELLSFKKVRVYIAKEALVKPDGYSRSIRAQTLVSADIDPFYGIEACSFDATIETMNRIQEEIIWGGD